MIPQLDNGMINRIKIEAYPSYTHRLTENNIIGYVDNVEALRQCIYHRVLTERYAYSIYDDNYGTELKQYIGQSFEYLEATIEDTLRDSLLQDDRITDVIVSSVKRQDIDSALIEFSVYANIGVINEMRVNIDV